LVLALVGGLAVSLFLKAKSYDNYKLAQSHQEEVFHLSSSVQLRDLLAKQEELWPVQPDLIGEYTTWLTNATELLGQLPQHRSRLEELASQALTPTVDDRETLLQSHPEYRQLETLRGTALALRRALGQRRGEKEVVIPAPDWSKIPSDAQVLDRFAQARIHEDRRLFGEEPLGVAYALRTTELEPSDPFFFRTLAYAYLSIGQDENAVNAAYMARELSSGNQRRGFQTWMNRITEVWEAKETPEALEADQLEVEALEEQLESLERTMLGAAFDEDDKNTKWWHEQLASLIRGIEELNESELATSEGLSREYGWSVPKRRAFAERLREGYQGGGEFWLAWERVLKDIRTDYPGITIEPEIGLIPIGQDPRSLLWEFADLHTGVPPERERDGTLLLTAESAAVFVLLRGGHYDMGAQNSHPGAPQFDAQATNQEGPVHSVWLSPFFLSKYELTQSQWRRLAGEDVSRFQPSSKFNVTDLNPVESLSWHDCVSVCRRFGWMLPSEAQWEYAVRNGTQSVYYTGADERSLVRSGAANLADRAMMRGAGSTRVALALGRSDVFEVWGELDDQAAVHAAVNGYTPNRWGLHGMLGNVAEWCLDVYEGQFYQIMPGVDPVNRAEGTEERALRGGSFIEGPDAARSAYRSSGLARHLAPTIGIRPARALSSYTSPFER